MSNKPTSVDPSTGKETGSTPLARWTVGALDGLELALPWALKAAVLVAFCTAAVLTRYAQHLGSTAKTIVIYAAPTVFVSLIAVGVVIGVRRASAGLLADRSSLCLHDAIAHWQHRRRKRKPPSANGASHTQPGGNAPGTEVHPTTSRH